MTELISVVTRKGQITVPAEIRRALGLKEGDKVALSLNERGQKQATLRPVRSVADLTFGSISPRRKPEDFRALRAEFEEELAENAEREGEGAE
jgi:AbrB family looped-hinge helix DNA binding protein